MRKRDAKYWLKVLPAILLLTTLAAVGQTEDFKGRVVKVVDGDTIDVLLPEQSTVRVRLAEIDTPERGQPFGRKAKQATIDLSAGKTVTVEVQTTDRYGRIVGEVFLPNKRSLNTELVRLGLAWQYKQYSSSADLAHLEAEARAAGRGLWSEPNPVPPWEWRRNKKKSR